MDTEKLVASVRWQWRRQIGIIERAERVGGNFKSPSPYLERLRTAGDAERLREFCWGCFGAKWIREVLGF